MIRHVTDHRVGTRRAESLRRFPPLAWPDALAAKLAALPRRPWQVRLGRRAVGIPIERVVARRLRRTVFAESVH
jgi:hypothetical protein